VFTISDIPVILDGKLINVYINSLENDLNLLIVGLSTAKMNVPVPAWLEHQSSGLGQSHFNFAQFLVQNTNFIKVYSVLSEMKDYTSSL
jgi:hypothetical protein